ncbi:argininosuccinate lyase [Alienimonas chondri]|uniref:Argininosuccinate lyase n=1 Tax=Alienimonas chondri TaxID=2681879 RepID=A0ABX1VL59_9PLAN|nr:argininosuccinate lyase [Alienimonas chondri]NNJ28041.1 Argininosuccinate lyase [Alienimonas chondri]
MPDPASSAAPNPVRGDKPPGSPGKAWGGRFEGGTDPRVEAFTESISFDARLAPHDVTGSKAHATMLAEVGLLTDDERDAIHDGLDAILAEIRAGKFPFRTELEDVHMHIESALTERIGDAGRKLHTARSRNDQVSTDLKLFVRESCETVDGLLQDLQRAFVGRCEGDLDVVIPGFTHLQRAMPVSASHSWLCWVEKLDRDRGRLRDCRARLNECPLGAAALAGTTLPIDRDRTAALMHFDRPAANSLDVSSDRDFLAEYLFALSLTATHLSQWAEEWVVWFSTEFGILSLPDAYTTGSSIMPQKRNPDVPELIRGKSARVVGALMQVMVLLKGLPTAYNRDLQEDKSPLFDAHDTVVACLELMPQIVAGATLNRERIAARLEDGFLDATALMEYAIRSGVPMRTAHGVIGKLVALCEQSSRRLADLTDAEFAEADERLVKGGSEGLRGVLGAANAAAALKSYGGGGREQVAAQIARWQKRLESK